MYEKPVILRMKKALPFLAAAAVVCIWSGWLTISRYGVQSSLEPADITLLRYWTALIVVLPVALRFNWRRFSCLQYLVIALGIGFPYTLLSFWGMESVRAAHTGVVVNGSLPVLGALASWFLFRQKISMGRITAIAILFAANLVMSGGSDWRMEQAGGIVLLLIAACVYTVHMTSIRLWSLSWQEVIVIVPVVNVLLFTPLWPFLPSALLRSSWQDIAVQALYQGVVVNVVALMCATYSIRHLGTVTVALFMALVPVTTALLAWLLLGEALNNWELAGIGGCSFGLLLYALADRKIV